MHSALIPELDGVGFCFTPLNLLFGNTELQSNPSLMVGSAHPTAFPSLIHSLAPSQNRDLSPTLKD